MFYLDPLMETGPPPTAVYIPLEVPAGYLVRTLARAAGVEDGPERGAVGPAFRDYCV
jgi:hypothetical protein